MERLSKVIKTHERYRPNAFECVYFLLLCLFLKYDKSVIEFDLLLNKYLIDVFPQPSKKLILPQSESIPVLVDIATLISIHNIDLAMQHFVLKTINVNEQNIE